MGLFGGDGGTVSKADALRAEVERLEALPLVMTTRAGDAAIGERG